MRGTVYFKKWSTMPWWSRLYHIRKYSYDPESQKIGKDLGPLINYIDFKFKTEIVHGGKNKIKAKYDEEATEQEIQANEDRDYFINELFDRYPQMRGMTIFDNLDETRNKNSQLYKVVETLYRKYREKLRAGFIRENAFLNVVNDFQDYIDLRLVEVGRTENIANSMRAMTFVDYLRAQKIKESHYKSKQLERDTQFDELEEIASKLNENHSIYHKIITKNPEDHLSTSNQEMLEELLKQQLIESRMKTDESNKGFIEKSFNLLNKYYEKELVQDRLAGLTNEEVLLYIRSSPSSLKKKFRPLIKFCQSHDIKLDAIGNLNYSAVKDKNLLYRIKRDQDKIKFVLMLNDIEFGFTHRLNQKKKLNDLRKQMVGFNKEATENFNKMNEERLKQLKEASELPISELDKSIGFEYADVGVDMEDLKQNLSQNLFKEKLTEDKFIEGKFDRIDWNEKLVDSIEERNLKLEQMWLQHRQSDIDDLDSNLSKALSAKYKKVSEDLRRLKLKLDKKALEKSNKVFFDEHISFNMDLEDVPIETLSDYFKINQETIEKNVLDLIEQKKVLQTIKPGVLVKDLIPRELHNVLGEKDTKEEFWDYNRKKEYQATEIKTDSDEIMRTAVVLKTTGINKEYVDDFMKNIDLGEGEKDILLKMVERREELDKKKDDSYKLLWDIRKERKAKTKKQKNIENRQRKKGKL